MKTVFQGYEIIWRRFFPDGTTLGLSEGREIKYFKTDRKDPTETIVNITKNEFFVLTA